MTIERPVPNPHQGALRPLGWADEATNDAWAAEDRGNPYPYGTGRWHAWNEGHRTAMSHFVRKIIKGTDHVD